MSTDASRPILIDGGRLIDPTQAIDRVARLLIVEGVVAAKDPSDGDLPDDCPRIDADGKIIAPGLIDLGAELREPGNEEDETIESACQRRWPVGSPRCFVAPALILASIRPEPLNLFAKRLPKRGELAFT